jgi:hypothetical protein
VAAVEDFDLVRAAPRDDLAAHGVAVQVDGDAVGLGDQPVPRAVEQVGGERRVLSHHRAASQSLGQGRSGTERRQSEGEDGDEDEAADGMAGWPDMRSSPDARIPTS